MKNLLLVALIILTSCAVNKQTTSSNPFEGDQVGCGDFIIYKLSSDNKSYLSVAFNVKSVELTTRQVYAIGKADVIEVAYKKYDSDISPMLCNDVMPTKPTKPVLDQVATSGTVEVLISDIDIEKAKRKEPYAVTLILKDVQIGEETIDYIRIDKTTVGWLPG